MAPPANSRIPILLLVLAFMVPVSAGQTNITQTSPDATSTIRPVPYTIALFIPKSTQIHSNQVTDLVSGPGGDVVIGTSFGLSTYNGTWSTRHMTLGNVSEGLLDDFITAVEFDRDGNLWIGYPDGIQIYDGRYYRTIRDQQLLKDTRIKDLQRWNDDMWVATGHSGIHRYRGGTWTWFQPDSPGGPGFYEVSDMALDYAANASLIATDGEGLWIVRSQDDPIRFECIAARDSGYGLLERVKRDPAGGVYFFNDSMVVHYSPGVNFTPVLASQDLSISEPAINDLAAAQDGTVYLATDRGIYLWNDGEVVRHLDRFEGIGTSSVVRTVNIDAENRVWFSTQDNVGYYLERSGLSNPVPIETVTSSPPATPDEGNRTTEATPASSTVAPETTRAGSSAPEPGGIGSIIDPLVSAIKNFLSGFGLK